MLTLAVIFVGRQKLLLLASLLVIILIVSNIESTYFQTEM